MGVYSNNRTQLGAYSADEIVANENYSYQTGLLEMIIDNHRNDQAIFEAVITNDFKEASGIIEESSVLLEASFVDKIKETLKKGWEKIKAFFKSFITKMTAIITRDNKELVNKYKKEVVGKDLSKMKFKWSEPKARFNKSDNGLDDLGDTLTDIYDHIMTTNNFDKEKEEIEASDAIDKILSEVVTNTTASEFAKDFHNECFEDQDVVEGLKSDKLMKIMNVLTNSSDSLKNVNKASKDIDKIYSNMFKTIEKDKNKTLKDETNQANSDMVKRQNLAYKAVQLMQTSSQKTSGCIVDAVKFHITQCRRVFVQAASFNPKSVREDAMLIEAIGESVEFEIMSTFADYSL